MIPWWQRKTISVEPVLMWTLVALVALTFVFWATAGWAEERCGGNVTVPGRSAVEEAKLYHDYHECMMRMAERDVSSTQKPEVPVDSDDETWGFPLGAGRSIQLKKPCEVGDSALTLNDKLIQCKGARGWEEIQIIPTVCEQKMEAAMRAMDEFVYQGAIVTVEAVHRSPQAQLRLEIERLNRRDAAKVQWDAVKKDCWRQP